MLDSGTTPQVQLSPKKPETLLELKGVCKRFGGLKAIDGVDITIPRGSLRCLIGANGAGKSTILKMIAGTLPVTSGSIWFKGNEITRERPFRRAHLGISMKMQIPGVYYDLSVLDNLRIALGYHIPKREMHDEIDRLLKRVSLSCKVDTLVRNLAHGHQQWLEIAMALGAKPDLLLLDEPTAGLGPGETAITAELIRSLNCEGVTIIVIEHDMEFVREIAQGVTVLHYGKVFAEGSMAEIAANEDVVRIYLGEI